jgi:bacteriophage N4 adsorption protein B
MASIDQFVIALLAPLAVAILISGLDDLLVDLAWACIWIKSKLRPAARLFPPGPRQLESAPRHRIAVFLPLWKEDAVIARMLEHNLAAIRYPDYHFFAGCYPNDVATQEAVRGVAARFPQVHLALCPHDGPTSKADCLNWIYQHLALHEERTGEKFDIVVTHDAEDMIHPEELRWINYYAARYDFVQTPVLALKTPFWKLTHGIYCDEFAENHSRDMIVRAALRGFVPGAGVGTGFRREALERLARASANRIFEPEALTEDYENGLRICRLGCTQAFVPIIQSSRGGRDFVVTRELFPQKWGAALRQRTRWVMGIALQGWQRLGWPAKPRELYWLWRDRKGLIGNPLSVAANAVFVYGVATQLWTRIPPATARIAAITLGLQMLRIVVRASCVGRIYGFWFALGVPLRAVYANALNSAATFQAVSRYALARARGEPLKWLKTEHVYPTRAALLTHKRRLGEILVGSGYLPAPALAAALANCPRGVRLGEHLVRAGHLDPDSLYKALSLQQGLPLAAVETEAVPCRVARALPEQVARKWQVLPFRIAERSLLLASPEPPSPEEILALRSFTALEVRFHLVTPDRFEKLAEALL